MALSPNPFYIRIPFTKGIETKSDRKLVRAPNMLSLRNMEFNQEGQINKRQGYTGLTYKTLNSDNIANGRAIYSNNEALILMADEWNTTNTSRNGPRVFSYISGKAKWQDIGYWLGTDTDVIRGISPSTSGTVMPFVAIENGGSGSFSCYVYESNLTTNGFTASYATVVDNATNSKVIDNIAIGTGIKPKIVAPGGIFLSWHEQNNRLVSYGIQTSSLSSPGQNYGNFTDLMSNTGSQGTSFEGGLWDIDEFNGEAVIVYKKNNATLQINTVTKNGAASLSKNITQITASHAIACFPVTSGSAQTKSLCIVTRDQLSGSVRAYVLDTSLNIKAGPVTVFASSSNTYLNFAGAVEDVFYPNPYNIRFFAEVINSSASFQSVQTTAYSFNLTSSTGVSTFYNVGLGSKAFSYGSASFDPFANLLGKQRAYFWAVNAHDTQQSYFLKSIQNNVSDSITAVEEDATIAKLLYRRGPGLGLRTGLPRVFQVGTNNTKNNSLGSEFLTAGLRRDRLRNGNAELSVVGLRTRIDIGATPQSVTIGNQNTLIGGGIIGNYDGRWQEHGWHLYPEKVYITPKLAALSPGNMSDGTYAFCATYEWEDRFGNIQESTPSATSSVVFNNGTLTQSFIGQVQAYNQTENTKGTNLIKINIYRTTNNGSVFYLTDCNPANNKNSSTNFTSTTTSGTLDDATLQTRRVLYTSAGAFNNASPPAAYIVKTIRDRVFLVPQDDRTSIWYSKPKKDGYAVEFAEELVISSPHGGDIIDIQLIDNNIVVFKRNRITYFTGEGLDANGQGNNISQVGYSTEQVISRDVGCIDRNSVVSNGQWIMFKSAKGMYSLDRGLNLRYHKEPEKYNTSRFIGSTILEDRHQIRFILSSSAQVNTIPVYDFQYDNWDEFTNFSSSAACNWQNQYTYVVAPPFNSTDNSGVDQVLVNYETSGSWSEIDVTGAGVSITGSVETGWLVFDDLVQGFGRIWEIIVLGDLKSSHTINMELAYDFQDAVVETVSGKSSTIVQGTDGLYQFRHVPKRQKCQAVKIKLYDSAQSGTKESFGLNEIQLKCGIEGKTPMPNYKII